MTEASCPKLDPDYGRKVCRNCDRAVTYVRPSFRRRGHWAHVGRPDRWYLDIINQRRRYGHQL